MNKFFIHQYTVKYRRPAIPWCRTSVEGIYVRICSPVL